MLVMLVRILSADRIEDDNRLFSSMRRGVRRDSMYSFSKSISQNRKENEQGKLPYWDGETALEWLKYYKNTVEVW